MRKNNPKQCMLVAATLLLASWPSVAFAAQSQVAAHMRFENPLSVQPLSAEDMETSAYAISGVSSESFQIIAPEALCSYASFSVAPCTEQTAIPVSQKPQNLDVRLSDGSRPSTITIFFN